MADDARTFPPSDQSLNDDRPNALERLDDTADALEVLRNALTGEEPLDDALQRLAETAAKAIPDADAVTVSVVTLQQPRTAAATDHLLVDVDEKQYSADRGPCLQSARTLEPVRAVVGEHRDEWPEFEAAAAEHNIRVYLSVPVILPATDRTQAEHVGSLFTTAASTTISSAQRWQRSREHIQQLERALVSRAAIDQAKGILMAVHKCTPEEAFSILVERSQHENVKLRDVAKNLLDSVMLS